MSSGLTIPKQYVYVAGSVIPTIWLLAGQTVIVSRFRKRAGIKYPQVYAEVKEAEASNDAHLFNCAQRAHQNTLELIPVVWATTLIAGIHYPILAASNLTLWTIGRIFYTRGYITGDPKKRSNPLSTVSGRGFLAMLALGTWSFGKLVWQEIASSRA